MIRFSWDHQKNELLKANKARGSIGFEEVLSLYKNPFYEAMRSDDPEQFVSTGWVNGVLYTLIFEEREDELGAYRHLVTFWKSSKEEQRTYEKHTK
jgi:hypothetical protein